MISLKTVERVLIPYIAAYSSNSCLSVHHNPDTIPDYSISKIHSPICLLATRERQIGTVCREFYHSLSDGSGKQVCPFGFEVLYLKIRIGQKRIILYGILSFDEAIFFKKIYPFSRSTKKKAKKELERKTVLFDADETYQFFSSSSDVLNTLLAGRVGASIRSLSHHILTPIQGAMADVENIVVSSDFGGQFGRLKRNLMEINDTSKRIQLLLAEQLEYSYNKVRRVTVHHDINKIISQLSSAATSKRISFNAGYNNVSTSIEAIPDQIFILLQNLIHNAFKYSHKGFENKTNSIDITYHQHNNTFLKIDICNIGCGITQKEIESGELFELGFRGELSDDRGRTGSGCGLYISNLIALAHKGKIIVNSEQVGEGNGNGQAYKTNVGLVLPIIQTQ